MNTSTAIRRLGGPRRIARGCRRGLAAGWLLIWSPVFLLSLLLAFEVGNVMLAKVQLVNALEAAALAGVKQWKESDSPSSARDYAVAYGAANTVSGEPMALDRNDSPPPLDANGNASTAGEIVLGAVERSENDECLYCLDSSRSPGGGGTGLFVNLDVRVETMMDTRNDFQGCQDGPSCANLPFMIDGFNANDGVNPVTDLEIASVTFDVTNTDVNDTNDPMLLANFDLRVKAQGNSNDKDFGLAPLFDSVGVSLTSGDFTPLPAHQIVGNNSPGPLSPTYSLNFAANSSDPFTSGAGDSVRFGVDTDGVGPDPPPNAVGKFTSDTDFADLGCDFAGTVVVVNFRRNGTDAGQIVGVMQNFQDANGDCQSQIQFINAEVMTGTFGVLTRKNMEVTPICAKLLGELYPFGPFVVCGEVVAICEPGDSPQLARYVDCTP